MLFKQWLSSASSLTITTYILELRKQMSISVRHFALPFVRTWVQNYTTRNPEGAVEACNWYEYQKDFLVSLGDLEAAFSGSKRLFKKNKSCESKNPKAGHKNSHTVFFLWTYHSRCHCPVSWVREKKKKQKLSFFDPPLPFLFTDWEHSEWCHKL